MTQRYSDVVSNCMMMPENVSVVLSLIGLGARCVRYRSRSRSTVRNKVSNPERNHQPHLTPLEVPEAFAHFADELSAQRYLLSILWPNGISCPHCGNRDRIGKLNGRSTRVGAYKCYACRKSFSLTHGTIFHSSHVPIHKWLQAIYLTEGGTRTVKPSYLQEVLNVSFKTAAAMIDRLGEAASLLKTGLAEQPAPLPAGRP